MTIPNNKANDKLVIPNTKIVKPHYNSHCFSNLPHAIHSLSTGKGKVDLPDNITNYVARQYDNVIFIFLDAFGWTFYEKFKQHPFLQRMEKQGQVAKLTSQFPSTTSAHVTTIHTAMEVGQSGIFEWQFYEPQTDGIIIPLLFSYAGDKKRETLLDKGIKPENIFPNHTIYQSLQKEGVESFTLQKSEISNGSFSKMVLNGSKKIPVQTFPEALLSLNALLEKQRVPSYYFLYYDHIDHIGHKYSPDSPEFESEVLSCLNILESWIEKIQVSPSTLLMISADHGQISIAPEKTIYLNRDSQFSGIEGFLKTNRHGQLLVPAGGYRAMFLYIQAGKIEEAQDFLTKRLEGRATVVKVDQLIEEGYFGKKPVSSIFLERIGDLVILPSPHHLVWWYEKGKFEITEKGQHGGLTPDEMEIPLMVYDFTE